MLFLVAGLDGIGHHVWDFIAADLPSLPRLQQVSLKIGFHKLSNMYMLAVS